MTPGGRLFNMRKKLFFAIAVFILLGVLGSAFAEDIKFEIAVDKHKMSLGQGAQISFTFHNIQNISAPDIPQIDNFEFRYIGPSTKTSIINGKISRSVTYSYQLVPFKKGAFTIGPFSIVYDKETYTSNSVTVEVTEGPVDGGSVEVINGTQMELEDRIFMVMESKKTKAYLNEIIPLTIKVYIKGLSIRDIQYPQFNHEGFSVEEYEQPRQYREVMGGDVCDVLEFNTKIFGVRPGKFILGPAEMKCNLVVRKRRGRGSFFDDDFFGGFFGGHQTHPLSLRSSAHPVTVLSLPAQGQPENFSGTLGSFEFNISAEPKEVKVGDPITLRMIIAGRGNLNTVTAPQIDSKGDFKVYDPQVNIETNAKVFEQIIMPKTDKIGEIPVVTFNFFDPEKETYQSITRGPIPIKVLPPEKEGEISIIEYPHLPPKALKREELGRGVIYIKELPGKLRRRGAYLYRNKGFLLFQVLPLILLAFLLSAYTRAERLRTDIKYARRLHASKRARAGIKGAQQSLRGQKIEEFYNNIFKTLQEYLGDKFHIPAGGITVNVVDEVLGTKKINKDILDKIRTLFTDCDIARYAPSEFGKSKMEETLKIIEEVIVYLERQRNQR